MIILIWYCSSFKSGLIKFQKPQNFTRANSLKINSNSARSPLPIFFFHSLSVWPTPFRNHSIHLNNEHMLIIQVKSPKRSTQTRMIFLYFYRHKLYLFCQKSCPATYLILFCSMMEVFNLMDFTSFKVNKIDFSCQ